MIRMLKREVKFKDGSPSWPKGMKVDVMPCHEKNNAVVAVPLGQYHDGPRRIKYDAVFHAPLLDHLQKMPGGRNV